MRDDLPTGTVTFLFTDVEGSTKLLHELGAEGYDEALIEHRRVLREAFARHGGVEVDTQGDAFFFAFPTAEGALLAAGEGQAVLADGPISVRMGLHTGTPHIGREGYIGDDVHLGARVAASGHGGQVILSAATAELVDLELTDLGEHRLKDILEAVPIFQLGEGSFPPLKTISNTNLPRPASSFVGRERETSDVVSLLRDGARLVTLSGPGGTGKTRLAIEAASELVSEYKAGVFWVGLATLRDPALVTETISQTLGAKDGLAEHIAERDLLLLLDNLEQVIESAPALGSLLTACPNLRLLVTSRELLRISGEVEYAVPPLAETEAIELFCARSQLAADDTIAELCRRLDSLPLAVELAASRTKVLTPEQILERLSQRLDALKGGRDADPRQQTLRATIEWSYELLSPEEQQLFAHLSVFAGGCTLEAAEEVCDADLDTLQSLVEKSLLRFTDGRYWMLETIREFAVERLEEAGIAADLRRAHAVWYGELVASREFELRALSEVGLATYDAELANARAGLAEALARDDVLLAGEFLFGLWFYWLTQGLGREAALAAESWLALDRTRATPRDTAPGLIAAGELVVWTELGRDPAGVEHAITLKHELLEIARAYPDAVYRRWSSRLLQAAVLAELTYLELAAGRIAQARTCADRAVAIRRKAGGGRGISHALFARAAVARAEGDLHAARGYLLESLELLGRTGNPDAPEVELTIAECDLLLGDVEGAVRRARSSIERTRMVRDTRGRAEALRVVALIALELGDAQVAGRLFGAYDRIVDETAVAAALLPHDREVDLNAREGLCTALGQAEAAVVLAAGRELTDGEAVDLALTSLPAESPR